MKDACSSLHSMFSEFNLPQGLNSLQMALTIKILLHYTRVSLFLTIPRTRGQLLGNSWSLL